MLHIPVWLKEAAARAAGPAFFRAPLAVPCLRFSLQRGACQSHCNAHHPAPGLLVPTSGQDIPRENEARTNIARPYLPHGI